jgi:transposase-like protein
MAEAERYRRRSAAQWRALVREYEASGLSQRAFCQRRGLVVGTFRQWRRQLASAAGSTGAVQELTPAVRLVPAQVLEERAGAVGSGIVVVTAAGVRIEVAAGFDAVTLQRVLASLGGRA